MSDQKQNQTRDESGKRPAFYYAYRTLVHGARVIHPGQIISDLKPQDAAQLLADGSIGTVPPPHHPKAA